jgi:hypothetical protein
MSSLHSQFAEQNWRDLYLQALFETDQSKMASRIWEAQTALLRREQQLFANADNAEREAVNSALHSLAALKQCFKISTPAAA